MKFDQLVRMVPPHGVFRTGHMLAGVATPANARRQLDRWCKSGRVLQLRRGVYALDGSYAKQAPHPFLVSNMLRRASYVSLQTALSHYGMIPEYVPTTTSVTTGKPVTFATPLGRFQYRHVTKPLFNGFVETEIVPEQPARIATPEKALIDLLYLTPRSDNEALLRELRLSPHPSFSDGTVLSTAAMASGSTKVLRAVNLLQAIWKEETM